MSFTNISNSERKRRKKTDRVKVKTEQFMNEKSIQKNCSMIELGDNELQNNNGSMPATTVASSARQIKFLSKQNVSQNSIGGYKKNLSPSPCRSPKKQPT